eukprot:TRINITY_DN821_c0_g1_i1.p1 TRINITY_DN821_c0_g1~~TRINITY_DN821_c0_g1_i1.p1  ORF type:complete len:514 (-),score=71.90 TRINITY_DN821_c0_g1_i1:14-1555(-)
MVSPRLTLLLLFLTVLLLRPTSSLKQTTEENIPDAPPVQASKFTTTGILSAIFVTLCLAYFTKQFLTPKKNIPPVVPYTIPWFGKAYDWGLNPIEMITKAYRKFGDVFTIKVLGNNMVLMVGSEAHEAFFNAPEDVWSAANAYRFTVPVFGKGIVYDCPPEGLVEQRKMVSDGLTLKRFKTYINKICKEVQSYTDKYWNSSNVELLSSLHEITVFTSTRCLHGDEVRDNLDTKFAHLFTALDRALSPLSFFYPYLPIPIHWNRDKAREKIKFLLKEIIEKRRKNNEAPIDMLQNLMESTYDDGKPLKVDDVCGLLTALMLAGQHTSNVTSTWLGIYLLQNPEALKRVYAELDEHWPKGEELDFNMIRKMTFFNNCLKETLRLSPPIIIILRKAMKDYKYKNYIIPKGSFVCASPAVVHRLEEYFTNPNTFNPDRFGPEMKEDKKNRYAYIPFSAGAHSCIGEKFAYVQILTIWALLLRKFEFRLKTKDIKPDFTTVIIGPKPPINVEIKPVSQ